MRLLNAFSLNMVASFPAAFRVQEISLDEAKAMTADGVESAVGHADTAAIFADQLGVVVPANRVTVVLNKDEQVLVGQYKGPRLPEGTTVLPAGATIQWLLVTLQ